MPSDRERPGRQGFHDTYDHRGRRQRRRDRHRDRKDSYEPEPDRRRRHRDRDRRRRDRQDTLDSLESRREVEDEPHRENAEQGRQSKRRDHISDSPVAFGGSPFDTPPPYETSSNPTYRRRRRERQQSRDDYYEKHADHASIAQIHDEEKGEHGAGENQTEDKCLTKLERFGGPWIYIIPILTAYCLLAAATCSSDWWRKDVNIVRVGLPSDVFARLLATGKNLGKSGGEEAKMTVRERAAKVVPEGWLSVGFWGWCISSEGDGQ